MSGVLKGGHEAKFIFTSGTLSPMEHQFINQNTNQHLVQPGHVWGQQLEPQPHQRQTFLLV